jgi:cellulose synthase/poly-beta-1,6-N-acetylglucosamine synthase-like glycosyltransferase
LKAQGLKIDHIRRENRSGYKAGALAYGLAQLKSEFVAVLDADFVPPPHFLRATVPFMVKDPQLGMVQGRWGHLNTFNNLLTMGQMLALDGHFVVEQTGRNRSGWLINFNGSGGIWRTKTIRDAGGWNDNTLTEDLDLSYRAQLKGWRFLYLPEVVVPGELPPQLNAYKQQQARWAKGGTQCLSILISPIWQSTDLTLMQRLMATMHLCQYMTAPLMMLLLLLTPPLMLFGGINRIPLGPLGLAGLGPPLVFIASQRALYGNWKRRAFIFPALMVLGTGMAWNNTKAVLEGLFKKKGEFKRTPKYAQVATSMNKYGLRGTATSLIEFGLALYSLFGLLLAFDLYAGLAPFMFIYTIAFGAVALWGLSENLHIVRVQRAPTT